MVVVITIVFQLIRTFRSVTFRNAVPEHPISTHTPLTGRNFFNQSFPPDPQISTHTPREGRNLL